MGQYSTMEKLYESILSSTKTGIESYREGVEEWFEKLKLHSTGNVKLDKNFNIKLNKPVSRDSAFVAMTSKVLQNVPKIVKLGNIFNLFISSDLYKKLYDEKRIVGPIRKISFWEENPVLSDIKINVSQLVCISGGVNQLKNVEIKFKDKENTSFHIASDISLDSLKEVKANCECVIVSCRSILESVREILSSTTFKRAEISNKYIEYQYSKELSDFCKKYFGHFTNLIRIYFAGEQDYTIDIHMFKVKDEWYKY